MKIINNFLVFNKTSELSSKIINNFFNRLKLFLIVDSHVPKIKVVFTGNRDIFNKFYNGPDAKGCLAFYDERSSTVVLNAKRLTIKTQEFEYAKHDQFRNEDLFKPFKYAIHLPVLYHEIIHHCQFFLGSYTYDPILEGSADLLTYILTGQDDIDYKLEMTAIWYLGRKVLKYNLTNFYNFVVSIINNEDHTLQQRFSNNRQILKTVVKKYKGDWPSFFKNIHKEYGNIENLENMKKELCELHNLIFYKY